MIRYLTIKLFTYMDLPNTLEDNENSTSENEILPLETDNEQQIIVTGFDIFAGHEIVNASWEAVRLLPDHFVLNNIKYKITKKLIKVEYEEVDKAVNEIWNENPKLVIHCGVHGQTKNIMLEEQAYNNKFHRLDYAKKRLPAAKACLENNGKCCELICSKFDVKKISHKVNTLLNKEITKVSKDVGNYLCGYIYLKSLDINCNRTLFVHVPKISEPYEPDEVSNTIWLILEQCIKQIQEEEQLTAENCSV